MNAGNIFDKLSTHRHEEDISTLVAGEGFRLVRIVSTGQATPKGQWYDQSEAEWVVVLTGQAGLRVEGEQQVRTLGVGDFILIPPHSRHRVEWTDPDQPTVWLALHFDKDLPQSSRG
jgi:cupin 2 domain-containing protein